MGKKFIASYSGGKDSMLALYRATKAGLSPVALITTYNEDREQSWFHSIPEAAFEEIAQSIEIPIWLIRTSGSEYEKNFEKALVTAKEAGAEVCVFGDIDIEEHRKWCTERCENAGIEALFPLWGESREELVYEFINSGFTANITVVDTRRMSDSFLGNKLTMETVKLIAQEGADICGENGEYHTFVSAGPLFKRPVSFSFDEKIVREGYAILPIK